MNIIYDCSLGKNLIFFPLQCLHEWEKCWRRRDHFTQAITKYTTCNQ